MYSKNELIFVNKILSLELTIRKAAKQLGLRRDDLIKRIREMLKEDKENLKKLDLILIINKILFGNLSMKDAAKKMKMTIKELDKEITFILKNNIDKKTRYETYKKVFLN